MRNLTVTFSTTDEDKDGDTGVQAGIDGLAAWSQTNDTHYDNWSTHSFSLNPPAVRLDDLAGRSVSVCMKPNGNDSWRFHFLLRGTRSDGLTYEVRKANVFLSTDTPCISWDATPDPTPTGTIQVNRKCLTATSDKVGSPIALNNCVDGNTQQLWRLAPEVSAPSPRGSRTGQIQRLGTECLGLPRGNTANGALIELQLCDGSPGQRWKWFGGDPHQINGQLNKCLDPNGAGRIVVSHGGGTLSRAIGGLEPTFLQYSECDDTSMQKWKVPACGGQNDACCESGMPCQGSLACTKGICSAKVVNVEHLFATLETTNEDKDNDTKFVISGVASASDSGTHYDDWSVHGFALNPSTAAITSIVNGKLFLGATPNGQDNWKLNFIVNGVRDDGTHYEFRKDNVWLANSDHANSYGVNWGLGPSPLDLVWDDTDENGLPLNPTWRGFDKGKSCDNECLDAYAVCPFHGSPLADDLDDYGQCSSQSPTYDRSSYCGWHANWFPATFDGTATSASFSTFPGDGDWHVDLSAGNESNIGRSQLIGEFDSDETMETFNTSFWAGERDLSAAIDRNNGNQARFIGLVGIDTEHEPPSGHAELHPLYAFSMRTTGSTPATDTWAIFVRNWGDEGACGGSQHYLNMTEFTLRFQSPPGAEKATSVFELPQTEFEGGLENGDKWTGSRTTLSPIQHDSSGNAFVNMTLVIGKPELHSFIDGTLFLSWKCGSNPCPQSPATRAKPRHMSARLDHQFDDELPGAKLLTTAQLSDLQRRFLSARPRRRAITRPLSVVPYSTPTLVALKPGEASLTVRKPPNPAKEDLLREMQKGVCNMLANNPKRPGVCNSLR